MLIYEKLEDGIYIVKSDNKFIWECNGILIKNVKDSGNILIDCNFSKGEYNQLLNDLNHKITAYFATHTHLDHVNNLHHLKRLKPDLQLYCPIPENEYLINIDNFINASGALDFGVGEPLKKYLKGLIKFNELKSVIGYHPGKIFHYGGIELKTIPALSHSPGHSVFLIQNITRDILFTSDMGLEDFGPWYGFKYNKLKDIRDDTEKIENLYLDNDFILASSHGDVFFKKNTYIFKQILNKINQREEDLINLFKKDPDVSKSLKDLALKGFIYNSKIVTKWTKLSSDMDKLISFWESYFILNHVEELLEKHIIIKVSDNRWILNTNYTRSNISNGVSS